MGIGKTTIAFCIHYIQHTINCMWIDIEQAPSQHYLKDDCVKDKCAKVCPSQAKMYKHYGFDCPCCLNSPTHFIKKRLGVIVALVPLSLINTWKYEFSQCFPSSSKQVLMIAHSKFKARNNKGVWNLL
jgi:hypothetical protein